jgi:hypothetical protein
MIPAGIAAGDLDNDGNQDLVVSMLPGLRAFLGDGAGGWSPELDTTTHRGQFALRDLNGDGKLDAITNDEVVLGNGDGTFGSLIPHGGSLGGATSVAPKLRDVDGDGRVDFVQGGAGLVSVGLSNGDGTFRVSSYPGAEGPTLAIGDFDRDGRPDIVTARLTDPSELEVQFGRCLP